MFGRSWLIYWMVIHCSLMVAHSGFFKEVVFYSFFILLQVLRYTHAARSLSWTPFQWSQSWAEYQPALSNYLQLFLGISLKKVNSSAFSFSSLVPQISSTYYARNVPKNCTHSADQFSRSCVSMARLLKSSCCIPWHVASTCTSTWAALSSGNFGLLGIVIGYTCMWLNCIGHVCHFDTYVWDIHLIAIRLS